MRFRKEMALIYRSLFWILILSNVNQLWADDQEFTANPNSSPVAVVANHVYYLQKNNYYPLKSSLSFNETDPAKRKRLAMQLKQIFDGKGYIPNINEIPDQEDYKDSATGKYLYYLKDFKPKISIEKMGNRWFYSQETVNLIHKLHKEVYPLGTDFLVDLVPYKGGDTFWGLLAWQWLGIGILFVAVFLFSMLLAFISRKIIKYVGDRQLGKDIVLPDLTIKLARSFSMYLTFALLKILIPTLKLNPQLSHYLINGIDIMTDFFLLFFVWRALELLLEFAAKYAKQTATPKDDQLVIVFKKILTLLIILVGLTMIFSKLGVNLTTILAGLSIGGLAIALAAQDVVKNLLGSVNLLIDQPFLIGDYIIADGMVEGVVEEIGLRSTRIKAPTDSIITAPNGKLAEMTISNQGLRVFRRFRSEITFPYSVPLEKLDAFREKIQEKIKENPNLKENSLEAYFNNMSMFGVVIALSFYYKIPKGAKERALRHEAYAHILEVCNELEIAPHESAG